MKDIKYSKKFKYKSDQDEYVFQMKRRPSWKWLLLLLLLLLFIPCNHNIRVKCIDAKTKAPIENATVLLDYTSHFLYKSGRILYSQNHNREQITDVNGETVFEKVECSVFSYIFYCLSVATFDAMSFDKSLPEPKQTLLHFTRNVVLELDNSDCAADIVMCMDNSGSMGDLLNLVKKNALTFYQDLKRYCAKKGKNLNSIRVRFMTFGDLGSEPFMDTGLLIMPQQKQQFDQFVSGVRCDGGIECGLEALACAMQTNWVSNCERLRHIIVVYTDEDAEDLGSLSHSPHYPSGMPRNFTELTNMWNNMDPNAKELILFAPFEDGNNPTYWKKMSDSWGNVMQKELRAVLRGRGYEDILDAISDSM